jgi:ABC-2 type transport system ATP-binding protein
MAARDDSELIRFEDVKVRRGDFVLDVPRWSVPAGCVVGIVGPNGAGKTTLLELLPGLRAPAEGSVRVFGHDPCRAPAAVRSRLGFMSAGMPIFDMRIDHLLRTLSGYYPSWNAALVDRLLEQFALDPRKRVHALSRGQGTRLRLMTALAFEPDVVVLDEPTSGLDLAGRHMLMGEVLDTVRDEGRSVVISSHQLQDVERLADRLLVLRGGEVLREGPTDEVVADERTLEEELLKIGAAG